VCTFTKGVRFQRIIQTPSDPIIGSDEAVLNIASGVIGIKTTLNVYILFFPFFYFHWWIISFPIVRLNLVSVYDATHPRNYLCCVMRWSWSSVWRAGRFWNGRCSEATGYILLPPQQRGPLRHERKRRGGNDFCLILIPFVIIQHSQSINGYGHQAGRGGGSSGLSVCREASRFDSPGVLRPNVIILEQGALSVPAA